MKTALASYPRSGNSWTRILIEKASGRSVGSLVGDRPYEEIGSGEPVAFKTHYNIREQFQRAIHLIRNPYDAIESYFVHRQDYYTNGLQWDHHVQEELGPRIPTWNEHAEHWAAVNYPRLLVRYEDLLADTAGKLTEILKFLDLPIDSAKIKAAVESSSIAQLQEQNPEFKQIYRRGTAGDGRKSFSDHWQRYADGRIGTVAARFGYILR